MEVKIIPCLNDNYSYLVFDKNKKNACIIDPSESEPVIKIIEKNKLNLKYILNTHHHYDHVGGNKELKKRYNSKVVGFKDYKNRIPEIDILVENNQIWKEENFEAKIYHIPGHTTGHIAFHFFKEKKIFTGDTLFSLGCGRIFEGTYEQMYNSLNRIKELPKDTEIYCGHEYTLSNANFCKSLIYNNIDELDANILEITNLRNQNKPTIPFFLGQEKKLNPFLRYNDINFKIANHVEKLNSTETFKHFRKLKDNY